MPVTLPILPPTPRPQFKLLAGLRLLLIGLHLVSGTLQAGLLFGRINGEWQQRLTSRWSRQLLTLLGVRIDSAIDPARIGHGLLVGNHISFIDIFVINALLPSAFVAKSDVRLWPLIGGLCRRTGTVFIERGKRKAAELTRQQMLAALVAGQRLAIFPEGTTTRGDRVLPFHGALFQSAIDAAVPVHALALRYFGRDGTPSTAPAYIDETSLIRCLITILESGGLVAQIELAASFAPPLAERRHLAHRAHQAIAATLGHPGHRESPQSLRNEA
ncbi:MAG: lysophospholipid acyltransferase family protein, partial [Rhodocyclaceae bacterium]|nr:lysophospholipid acyltransferase family protein [Rhodocyclaceae bacterium]